MTTTRENEWYSLKRGPKRLRAFINMTFFPYTLMNASYVLIGSMIAPIVHWDRVGAITLVYILAVGITAHALDAMGPNKPWGAFMTNKQLLVLALVALLPALGIGVYYSVLYAPLLLVIGALELFFLFSYNLELFGSRFHSERWFAFSWGFLPVLAGYVVQANTIDITSFSGGLFGLATAYVEANASRPYKLLKRKEGSSDETVLRFERILKGVVGSVLSLALLLTLYRALG